MRTILTYGTDIHGPEDWWDQHAWVERPIDPYWSMTNRASMNGLMYEASAIAGIDGLALVLRGDHDGGFKTQPLKASIEEYAGPFVNGTSPTLLPFIDTGALSAITGYDAQEVAFDFANSQHLEWFWERFLRPFYLQFPEGRAAKNPIRYERTTNGRPLVLFWGINPSGAGVVNQAQCQRLLDTIRTRMVEAGLGVPDVIVDQSWLKYAPNLNVFGVHDWFSPPKKSWSTRTHHGVTVGMAVPGFHVATQPTWTIARNSGRTLLDGLAAIRAANADIAILEGFTDASESAGFYRSDAWTPSTLYLDIIREHIQVGRPVPVPEPVPTPTPGGSMAYARLNGKYIGVDPGIPAVVYANRDAGHEWEELVITKHEPYYDIRARSANRQVGVDQGTGKMVTRNAGDIGGWGGQWAISDDGKTATCDRWTLALEGFTVVKPLHLQQRGQDFVDPKGNRVVYPGCDMFLAYRQYLDGGAAALVPFVQESNALGFTAWRVFMQGSKAQNQVLELSPRDTGYYEHLRGFADTLNANGIILLATVFVDNQDVKAPADHWLRLAGELRGTATLLSGGNQWNKNGFDPYALPDPGGFIWSRGSAVEDTITDPRGATASELHATRNSFDRALMDSTASPPFMRSKGAGMVWMTEGNPFGDGGGYSEHEAWKLGRGYSIDWALAIFHNRQSQRGLLMNADTAKCGAAWVQGMQLFAKAA